MADSSYWARHIAKRFPGRRTRPLEDAYRTWWSHLPREPVLDFLGFLAVEFAIDPSVVRPSDDLSRLTGPVRTKNPLEWFVVEPRLEDATSELSFQLRSRLKNLGTDVDNLPATFGEAAEIWCGEIPGASSQTGPSKA